MPLRYVDPTRPTNFATRALNRSSRSRFGQFIAKNLASKTDPWLGRISNGRISWGMFNVPSATLKSTGAKTGQVREAQIAYFHDGPDVIVVPPIGSRIPRDEVLIVLGGRSQDKRESDRVRRFFSDRWREGRGH